MWFLERVFRLDPSGHSETVTAKKHLEAIYVERGGLKGISDNNIWLIQLPTTILTFKKNRTIFAEINIINKYIKNLKTLLFVMF